MKRKSSLQNLLLACICSLGLLSISDLHAQQAGNNHPTHLVDSTLYKEIIHMDNVLFNGFNARSLDVMKEIFDKDLEFYHDKGGLTFYAENIEISRKNFERQDNDLRRDLLPDHTEIYPIAGYGAIQVGMHRFCHTENGKPDCGTFKFLHVWQKKGDKWKITRVISYDHR